MASAHSDEEVSTTATQPKVPKYSPDEYWDIIDNRWMRGRFDIQYKDACLDKFLIQLVDTIGTNYWEKHPCYFALSFDKPPWTDIEDFESMQQGLFSDLESLLPGYFSELPPSASVKDKFDPLIKKIEKRWKAWLDSGARVEAVLKDPDIFQKDLLRVLAEKNAQLFSSVGSSAGAPLRYQDSLAQVFKQLAVSIEGEQKKASFSCGGSIAVTLELHQDDGPSRTPADFGNSPPITIYWSSGGGQLQKTSLPYKKEDDMSPNSLEQLVNSCAPATFGRGDEDVLDTSYRNAGALDPDSFCTTFHPADFGIINSIEQLLLPSIDSQAENEFECRRVKAELYKLNVYSGPSGIFRKHVNTPRSTNQFGSLVVCLPSSHEGGHLSVSHDDHKVKFDWNYLSASSIQWAAFYSDCEHEISRVSRGHRITLTYNLYVVESISVPPVQNPIVDVTGFPMYRHLKDVVGNPGFLKDGGAMGFFCSHSYPHSDTAAASGLPRGLKGADMSLFSVLQSLGLMVKVLPILEHNGDYITNDQTSYVRGSIDQITQEHYLYFDYRDKDSNKKDSLRNFRMTGEMTKRVYERDLPCGYRHVKLDFHLNYRHLFEDFKNFRDLESHWKVLLMARYPRGTTQPSGAWVGNTLHPYKVADAGGEDDPCDEVAERYWRSHFLPGITWLSRPKHEKRALSHMIYGNNASTVTRYSCAAIIAIVPPFLEREIRTSERPKDDLALRPAVDPGQE